MLRKIVTLTFVLLWLCSCDSEKTYNKENRKNTTGVDYSIYMNLKSLMITPNGNGFEMYYTINMVIVNSIFRKSMWDYQPPDVI